MFSHLRERLARRSGGGSGRRRVQLATIGASIAAAALLAPTATLAAMSCGNAGGSICCGSSYQLPVRWIYLSSWAVPASGSTTYQYWARRYDDNNNLTWNEERPTGGNYNFDNNGFHGWRGTRIYRAKSPNINTSISQATNAATCFG